MTLSRRSQLSAAALALALLIPTTARGEIIPLARMLRGITMTAAECAAKPFTVWVTAYQHSICIRYYLSDAGGTGMKPVVYLSGDKLGSFNAGTETFAPLPTEKDVNTETLHKNAETFSKTTRTTAIYLARVGLDGSSGYHGSRRTMLELHIVNQALDAIKARHRLQGFHLFGQSGGAALVAALPALRSDIGCVVAGAGPLSAHTMIQSRELPRRHVDPSELVSPIAANRSARIFVVTDPVDHKVPLEWQMMFVRKLRQAGGAVDQFFVEAPDEQRHNVANHSLLAVAGCVRGVPTLEISGMLDAYTICRRHRFRESGCVRDVGL